MTDRLPDGWLHVIIDVPPAAATRSGEFWAAAFGWPLGEPFPEHPEFAAFVPPDGESYVHRQLGDHGPVMTDPTGIGVLRDRQSS